MPQIDHPTLPEVMQLVKARDPIEVLQIISNETSTQEFQTPFFRHLISDAHRLPTNVNIAKVLDSAIEIEPRCLAPIKDEIETLPKTRDAPLKKPVREIAPIVFTKTDTPDEPTFHSR